MPILFLAADEGAAGARSDHPARLLILGSTYNSSRITVDKPATSEQAGPWSSYTAEGNNFTGEEPRPAAVVALTEAV